MNLDEVDVKIINILMEDSRRSYSDIARAMNLSRQTVKTRIEKLEENGVIEKYTIELNPRLIGHSIILIVSGDPEFLERLKNIQEVCEIAKVSSKKFVLKVLSSDLGIVSKIEDAGFEIQEILPIISYEKVEKSFRPKIKFRCDYCGKEVNEEPLIFKFRNKIYVLCCPTCLREFKAISED